MLSHFQLEHTSTILHIFDLPVSLVLTDQVLVQRRYFLKEVQQLLSVFDLPF